MTVTNLFPTPIWTYDFADSELAHIQDEISKKMTAMLAQSNPAPWGDYMTTTWNPNRNTDIEQFQLEGLALGIIQEFRKYMDAIEYVGDGLRLKNSWFSWNKKGGFSFDSCHPHARVMGIYFYQSNGDDGVLRFSNPHPSQTMGHWPCDYKFTPYHYVEPKAGRLVLFPAHLTWRIEPNCTDHELVYCTFTLV